MKYLYSLTILKTKLFPIPTKVNNCVLSLQLNYLTTLLCNGDFTLVNYEMVKLEYIHIIKHWLLVHSVV